MAGDVEYLCGGVRALVELHERHLWAFIAVHHRAREAGVVLPPTDDPAYRSLDELLTHVVGAAGRYLIWISAKLGWPAPALAGRPGVVDVVADPGRFVDQILREWDRALRNLRDDQIDLVFQSSWGIDYCIDGMLEHAVMHPIRHTHQLEKLMAREGSRMSAVHPVLPVKSLELALEFYRGRLGFTFAFVDDPENPRYAAIRRDGVELHLQWHEASEWDRVERPSLRFMIENVEALHREFADVDVFHETTALRDTMWGTREFAFFDPDGNGLTFYEDRPFRDAMRPVD